MGKILLLIILCLVANSGMSQIKTNVNATGIHEHIINTPLMIRARVKEQTAKMKAYMAYTQFTREYRYAYDSVKFCYLDSMYVISEIPDSYKSDSSWMNLPDSLVYDFKKYPDSMRVSNMAIEAKGYDPQQIKSLTNPPLPPSAFRIRQQIRTYKKSVKIREEYNEEYLFQKDVYLDSIYIADGLSYSMKSDSAGWSSLPDSLIYDYDQPDSLIVSKRAIEELDIPEDMQVYLNYPMPDPREMLLSQVDSTMFPKPDWESFAAMYAPEGLPESAGSNSFDARSFVPTEMNPDLVQGDQMQSQFEQIDPEEMADRRLEDEKNKRKFSALPDSTDPDGGTKRNSLEGVPFKKRIYFGGNLNISSTDPLIVDFGVQLGYWINKKWLIGKGFNMREQFYTGNLAPAITGSSWKHSLFSRYNLPKSFFAITELERNINQPLFGEPSEISVEDVPVEQLAWLAGVGRDFNLNFVRMNFTIQYDFTWRTNYLYASPFVMKFGFQITKLPGFSQ